MGQWASNSLRISSINFNSLLSFPHFSRRKFYFQNRVESINIKSYIVRSMKQDSNLFIYTMRRMREFRKDAKDFISKSKRNSRISFHDIKLHYNIQAMIRGWICVCFSPQEIINLSHNLRMNRVTSTWTDFCIFLCFMLCANKKQEMF